MGWLSVLFIMLSSGGRWQRSMTQALMTICVSAWAVWLRGKLGTTATGSGYAGRGLFRTLGS